MAINPSWGDLALTGILFGIVLFLSWRENLGLERTFIHAAARTVAQLALVGYVIEYVFHLNRWYWVLGLLAAMNGIAAYEGAKRFKSGIRGISGIMWISIFAGTFINTFVVTEVIVRIDPWWDPRYMVPLAGMIMGNALNSGSLAGERFLAEIRNRGKEVETLLSLGFTSRRACAEMKRSAVRGTLIPTLNSMFTVGLVHLPGMMTGQILGGSAPAVAAKYQIVVMFMITSTVMITALILMYLLQRRIFSSAHQLLHHLL